MWYGSLMPDLDAIRVPLTWAGYTRRLDDGTDVWACGACPDVEACREAAVCARASEGDFEYAAAALGRVT